MLVLASGQSNMRGRLNAATVSFAAMSRVKVWNNANPLGSNGTAFVAPVQGTNPFNLDGSSNLAVWFCHRLSQELNTDVKLILVCRDGSDITYWHPTTGTVYQEIEDVHAATGEGAADILLWHQGETGESDPVQRALYKTKWITMRNALRTAGIIKQDAPTILGGLQGVRIGGQNDLYLQELAAENDDVYYASSVDLPSDDNLHFSGNALRTFGYHRYWEQYAAHIDFKKRVDGSILAARGII